MWHLTEQQSQRRGFTLAELLIVIGIVAILISLLLPALNLVRRSAEATRCAGNLRTIGQVLVNYAVTNRDWIPRDSTGYKFDDTPGPFMIVMRAVHDRHAKDSRQMPLVRVLQCDAHPRTDNSLSLHAGYVANAMPNIRGRQPVDRYVTTLFSRLSAVRRSSNVVYIVDASNNVGVDYTDIGWVESIFMYDVWEEHDLTSRASADRHGDFSNALMFDGSVTKRGRSQLKFEDFDDGMRGQSAGRVLYFYPTSVRSNS